MGKQTLARELNVICIIMYFLSLFVHNKPAMDFKSSMFYFLLSFSSPIHPPISRRVSRLSFHIHISPGQKNLFVALPDIPCQMLGNF